MLRRANKRDGGAAAVEFAFIAALVLIPLMLVTLQFGFIFFQWLQVNHLAREGARWGSLQRSQTEIVARVTESATDAGMFSDLDSLGVTVENAYPDGRPGEPVTVTVRYPVQVFAPYLETLLGVSESYWIRGTAVQRIE